MTPFKTAFKIGAAILALACVTFSAHAQFDAFGQLRTVALHTPQLISGGAAGPVTTLPVDTHGFAGIAILNFTSVTNAAGGTITVAIQTSADTNTWNSLSNAAYATSTTVFVTNGSLPYVATNTFLLPGTVVIPTASSAGFSTPYLNPAPFTNTVSALTITANGTYSVGYNISDAQRYVRVIYTTGGSATNSTVSATLTGRRALYP